MNYNALRNEVHSLFGIESKLKCAVKLDFDILIVGMLFFVVVVSLFCIKSVLFFLAKKIYFMHEIQIL